MRAVFTDPGASPCFTIREAMMPVPSPDQALIKVKAFSLNQGETRTALAAADSYIPGWDFAGVVVKTAADGSTPKEGSRVFGYVARGSWAEYLTAPGGFMAAIPDGITDEQAACLPIAGFTALACLDASGDIRERRVLITGASGGVGRLACQMAAMAGAKVFAVSRRAGLSLWLERDGIKPAGIFTDMEDAKAAGEYDVVWDAAGGNTLATALTSLARNGVCINYGNSSRQPTTFDVRTKGWPFHGIRCIWLGREPVYHSTPFLERLAGMVKTGDLHVPIDSVLSWTSLAGAAEKLIGQRVNGKIVLQVV